MRDRDRSREELLREVENLRVQVDRHHKVARLRGVVSGMARHEDIGQVAAAVRQTLGELGIRHRNCEVNLVDDPQTPHSVVAHGTSTPQAWQVTEEHGEKSDTVIGFWRSGQVVYRPDLEADDPYAEGGVLPEGVRSVIDVPFEFGTLALSSLEPDAFSPEDIQALRAIADVLSQAIGRWHDLHQLAARNTQLTRNLEALRQAERCRQAVSRIRTQVWRMEGDDDLPGVLDVVAKALRDAGLAYRDCDINLVEPGGASVRHYDPDRSTWLRVPDDGGDQILRMWRDGVLRYRPDLERHDEHGDAERIEKIFGHQVRSVVDVPFAAGTLALNSEKPEAFSQADLALLQDVAGVLSEGVQRARDLSTLRASEAFVQQVIEALPVGVAVSTADLARFEYMNDNFPRIWRASRQALSIPNGFWAAACQDPECRRALRRRVLEDGSSGARVRTRWDDMPIVRPGEETTFVTLCVAPIEGTDQVLWTVWDVTDRTRVQQALRASQERYRQLVENAPVCIHEIDRQGRLVSMNRAGLELLDIQAEEAVRGRSCLDIAADRDRDRIRALFERAWTGEPVFFQFQAVTDDRSLFLDSSFVPLHDEDGEVTRLMGLTRDLTQQRRMEKELVRLERMRALGEMARGVSHNLNNILVGVKGPAQLLQRFSQDPVVLREADAILSAATRAADLVQQLHQAVHAEAQVPPQAVNLNTAVLEALEAAGPGWETGGLEGAGQVDVVTELTARATVAGVAAELHEMLLHLLGNAVEAMPRGGTLTLRTRDVEAGGELEVADTGIGMDDETRRRVFEPFFTTKADVGTGLGLSAVHGTLSRWGGRIDVESAPGQGSRFTLWFPAARPQSSPPIE